MLNHQILVGILLPFLGTCLGAALAFFMRSEMNNSIQRCLTGFAAGVMIAASVWSLLIPSLQQATSGVIPAFVPAVVGFWAGILFLLLLDNIIPHLHADSEEPEGIATELRKTTMLVFAVTIHNIPEGMAVGVVFAGWHAGNTGISIMAAVTLALGIAIQNFPEGAIISMPLQAQGMSKGKAFFMGVLSGAVEPIAAILTMLAASHVVPVLSYI